jgi:hypothetical protein
MTKIHGWVAAVLLTAAALPAHAETFDLNINDSAVAAQFNGPLSQLFNTSDGEYQIGGLYSSDRHDVTKLHAGVLLTGDAGAQDAKLTAGIGVRGNYVDAWHQYSGGGAEIGGQFDLRFAGFERLGFQGNIWYQPDVLGLGDIESELEWALTADYQILRNADVYVGYRKVSLDTGHHGLNTYDNGAIFGLRLTF